MVLGVRARVKFWERLFGSSQTAEPNLNSPPSASGPSEELLTSATSRLATRQRFIRAQQAMPSVTHDGRSFMIEGRRVWLASGRVPYARVPRSQWAARIQAAKNAGLNTIETPVFWSRHEPRPGRFDFTGENDLRNFVDLVGKAGMYCILGLGPYVGSDWDFGGLPAYLRESASVNFRTNNHTYLEACSRFISAVADQIRGWQVTAPGTGGPIILLQCESEWTCGHDTLSTQYLGELTRYIRESGLSVPIVNSNDLWQNVEGQIDGWSGGDNMLATMRQLASVRQGQPRMVIDFAFGHSDMWGHEPLPVLSPRTVEQRLAEILAGGGQFNITTFAGGTNFGFFGGRTDDGPSTFATHAADRGCAIDQTGGVTDVYGAIKRVATAATKFGRVFASLDPVYQPVSIKPGAGEVVKGGKSKAVGKAGASPSNGASVVHATGTQGGVAFVFAPDVATGEQISTTLLLGDGNELPVPLGEQPVAWCLLGVNVSPRCHMEYANLSALCVTNSAGGSVAVFFGPAGSRAMFSINGSPMEAMVPTEEEPEVLQHEGLTIVIVRTQDTDIVAFADDAVLMGVKGMSASGAPIAMNGAKTYLRITGDGKTREVAFEQSKTKARAPKIEMEAWRAAHQHDYVRGESPRFAVISKVQGLAALGAPYGYGWYRFALDNKKAGSVQVDPGVAGDRLHVFSDGKPVGLMGVGPGATPQMDLGLKKGEQTVVILAENLGRFAGGMNVGEPKGLVDDLFSVSAIKLGKLQRTAGTPVPLLAFKSPIWDVADGDASMSDRAGYTFKLAGKQQVIVRISTPPTAGLMILNDKPIAYLDRSGPTCVMLPSDHLQKGNNTLELTVVTPEQVGEELAASAESMEVFIVDAGLSQEAEVAFAKWEAPDASAYLPLSKAGVAAGQPAWFKCEFTLDAATMAVFFEPKGLTKGQMFVNGKHVGRYFVATKAGKVVPPQERYYIPEMFLKPAGEANELLVFDEHGATPTKAKISL